MWFCHILFRAHFHSSRTIDIPILAMSNKGSSHIRLGGTLKTFTKSSKSASDGFNLFFNSRAVGRGKDMSTLLLQLRNGSVTARAATASEIVGNVEKYSTTSLTDVWYLARDLCDSKNESSIRRTGIKLMILCITNTTDSVSNKLMLFNDLMAYCEMRDPDVDFEFDLFLNALQSLTDDGRDIHDLYIYDPSKNWGTFVLQSYAILGKSKLNDLADQISQNFLTFTNYLGNCFKYSFNVIDEQFIISALNAAISASEITENPKLLTALLDLIRKTLTYGFIPQDIYPRVANYLCWTSVNSEEMHVYCWDTLRSMYNTFPFMVVKAIFEILQDPDFRQILSWEDLSQEKNSSSSMTRPYKVILGAFDLLELILIEGGSSADRVDYIDTLIISSLIDCARQKNPVINSGLLRIIDHLFADSELSASLFPFQSWYSSGRSIFTLLSIFEIDLEQDENYWKSICSSIYDYYSNGSLLAPKNKIIDMFMKHPRIIPDHIAEYVLTYYEEERLCAIINPSWKENCNRILDCFYYPFENQLLPPSIRINALNTIMHGYEFSFAIADDFNLDRSVVLDVFKNAKNESSTELLNFVIKTFLSNFLRNSSLTFLQSMIAVFLPILESKKKQERIKSIVSLSSYGSNSLHPRGRSIKSIPDIADEKNPFGLEYLDLIAKTFCNFFVIFSQTDSAKAKEVYEFLLSLLRFCLKHEAYGPLLTILKCFMRLRVTSDKIIYFVNPGDMAGIATALKRNKEKSNYQEDNSFWWTYPEECDYLPGEYFGRFNKNLKAFNPDSLNLQIGQNNGDTLDLSSYIKVLVTILEDFFHWELYSFCWSHLCSQLANRNFFNGQDNYIFNLHAVLCDQLTLKLPKSFSFPSKGPVLTKLDLQVVYIRTMSALIGYHDAFRKAEEDQIVSSLLFSLDSWNKTAIPSIHLLSVCCYEIPLSIKKYFTAILTRLQNGVTSAFASSPALEFLMSLIDVPLLISNFTLDDFKRVFAIAFKYMQYSLDAKRRLASQESDEKSVFQSHGVDAEVDNKTSTEATETTPTINEYLLVLSQMVVCRLFLKINLFDRRQFSGFLIRNIISSSGCETTSNLNERTVAFLDFIYRFTYSDIPLKIVTNSKRTSALSLVSSKWIIGKSIVTIDTEAASGTATITLRGPTGTSIYDVKLDPIMLPAALAQYTNKPILLNAHYLLQLIKPLDSGDTSKPISLFDDATTDRAISTLDRIAVVSHHKAGIMYIGPGQTREDEILGNSVGSDAYNNFLNGLGQLIRLKDTRTIYVGGLDSENGTDGDYAYFWSDHISQLIFHTTTMMPNAVNDKYFSSKKRHIGNNYVNVFFDESGVKFNFNVIKSQFNFINIVILPHTLSNAYAVKNRECEFYVVKIYRRSGVPGIFSTTHLKLISREQLPHFVRNTVLIANRFAHVWHYSVRGDYTTNWELRVRHIDTICKKASESHLPLEQEQMKQGDQTDITKTGIGVGDNAYTDMTKSFLQQLQPSTFIPVPVNQAISKFDYVSKTDTGVYSSLEFNSYA